MGFVSRRPTAASAKSCHLPDARRSVRARAFCGSVGGRGHSGPRPPGLSQPFGSYLCITMQLVRDPRKRKVAWLIVHFCSILAAGLEDCTRDLWQAGLFFEGASNGQSPRPRRNKK